MPGRHAAHPLSHGPVTAGQLGRAGITAVLVTAAGAAAASTGAFAVVGSPAGPASDVQAPTAPAAGTALLAMPAVIPAPAAISAPAIEDVSLPAPRTATAAPQHVATTKTAPNAEASTASTSSTASKSPAAAPATAAAGSLGSRLVAEAAKHKGTPYVWGATGPSSFDCSGFTSYVFKKMGISLPRTAQQQYNAAQHLNRSQAQPGDLIFNGSPGSISHVAIYAGNEKIWTAPQPGESVKLGNLWGNYSVGRIR